MFAYCLNNPVNGFDPSGTRFQDPNCRSCGGLVEYTDSGTGSYSIPEDGQYIADQENFSASSWPLGCSTVGKSGCGIVTAYNILISHGADVSFSDVYFAAYAHGALDNAGRDGTDAAKMIEVIIDLDPSISISYEGEPIESVFIIYGFYEDGRRIGGHAAAAIHYWNQYFIIYTGIGVTDDCAYDLNSYFSAIDECDGISIDGWIAFH